MLPRTSNSFTPRFHGDRRRMGRAQAVFAWFIILLLGWFNFFNPYAKPIETLILATAVVLLGLLPLYRWVGDPGRDAIPVLHIHAAFYALTYGIVGLMEPGTMFGLNWTSEEERQVALGLTLLGLSCLYIGYYALGSLFKKANPVAIWPVRIRPRSYSNFVLLVFPMTIVASKVADRFGLNFVDDILAAIYNFAFILVVYGAFSGAFNRRATQFVVFLLIPYQLVFGSNLASSLTFGFIFWSVVIGLIYLTARRRVPYVWILLALSVFLLLQPVKKEYRALTWNEGVAGSVTTDKLMLFVSLAESHYLGAGQAVDDHVDDIRTSTFDRLNNLNTLAAVVADTPNRQPYLLGESYVPLLTKFIPRFLFPGKPLENFGNVWANRYGYLGASNFTTSFNLPWLPEMYINFGLFGIAFLNIVLGLLFALLANAVWRRATDPSTFAFGMVLGTPLFFVESNLSLLVGELVIVVITLYIIGRLATVVMPSVFVWCGRSGKKQKQLVVAATGNS